MVIELSVVQFWSEIILVISNRTRAARSFDFEITRMISDQIALHSVQLPLLIGQYASCLSNWTVCAITRMLIKLFFHLLARKSWNFLSFDFKKSHIYHSDVLLKL